MPVTDAQPPHGTTYVPPALDARVAVTGRLALIARADLEQTIARAGGRYVPRVTRRTSHLVVGMNGWPLSSDGGVSGKLRRADELRARGAAIAVLTEEAFLELIGERAITDTAAEGKSIPAEHVLAATGIDAETLRRWEFAGLVRSHDGRYDFQDLVSLQTVAELVGADVAPATIARSVRGLASVLPGTDRPLSQLRLVVEHGRSILGGFADGLVTPEGQFVFAFERDAVPETAAIADVIRFGRSPASSGGPPPTAETAFDRGIEFEDRGQFADAESAYRDAIARRPEFPEAHFNLGNVLRVLGHAGDAEEHFRRCIALSPDFAEAWFNLADLQEELGRTDDAVACLDRAVAIAPDYPDAHFNLARMLESLGRHSDARPHWRTYLEYDAGSDWAHVARRHLLGPS